ncbi:ARF/SAR superfamily [Nadsonia fulvescens var. elongata DSM 6958]|uniref:ARF/SAR superfamily n=1 Tax=Nadsonia fulvescens var. elongata DSM 6958 TaxID=857566 RepID=A0A1E3PSF7_9ASCO|nr:ARF/SAR superfamily [Nadsonia fulvescens var. elongata DSM 6958]
MGLLTIIKKQRLKDKEIRVVMLGLDNAGKTTIVKSLLGQDCSTVSPTLGFNIQTLPHAGFRLSIWDIGGQRTLRPFWRNYFEKTDFLIWVVDITTDGNRLEECRDQLKVTLTEDRLSGAGLLVWINKMDLINGDVNSYSTVVDQMVELLELKQIKGHKWLVLPCSALSGYNLIKGLDFVTEEVGDRLYRYT